MRLPPGVSESDFKKALAEFEQVVGADWVFTSDADVDLYRDAYSPFAGEPEELVLRARSRRIHRAGPADRSHREPLSRAAVHHLDGKNLGYGGSAPDALGQRRARPQAHEPHPRGQ
jgi:4-cresol dehydrogenase (hydroxylating)